MISSEAMAATARRMLRSNRSVMIPERVSIEGWPSCAVTWNVKPPSRLRGRVGSISSKRSMPRWRRGSAATCRSDRAVRFFQRCRSRSGRWARTSGKSSGHHTSTKQNPRHLHGSFQPAYQASWLPTRYLREHGAALRVMAMPNEHGNTAWAGPSSGSAIRRASRMSGTGAGASAGSRHSGSRRLPSDMARQSPGGAAARFRREWGLR